MARTVQAKLEECRAALKAMGRDRNYWMGRAEKGEERIGELRGELTEEREANRQILTRLNRADARIGRLVARLDQIRGLNNELRATLTKERAEASASKWSQARDQADPPVNLVAPPIGARLGWIIRYPSTRPNNLRPQYAFYRPDTATPLDKLRDYTRRSRGELYEVRTNMVRLELDAREADPPATPSKTIPRPDPCTAEYTPAGEKHTYRCRRHHQRDLRPNRRQDGPDHRPLLGCGVHGRSRKQAGADRGTATQRRRRLVRRGRGGAMKAPSLTYQHVASVIGVDLGDHGEGWANRCHEISLAIVRSGLVDEFYDGKARVARGWARTVRGQHSWVSGDDVYSRTVRILDPTIYPTTIPAGVKPAECLPWFTIGEGVHQPHGQGSIWAFGHPENCDPAEAVTITTDGLSSGAQLFLRDDMLGPLDQSGWAKLYGTRACMEGWPAGEILDRLLDEHPDIEPLIPIDIMGMLTDRNPENLYR